MEVLQPSSRLGKTAPALVVLMLLSCAFALVLSSAPKTSAQGGSYVTGIGPWVETTDYGASSGSSGSGGVPIDFNSCVAYQSDIYCVGGEDFNTGNPINSVYYAQFSPSGSLGAWANTTSAPTGLDGPCVQYDAYIYCLGGQDVYYAQLSSSGVGTWTETTGYGASSGTARSTYTPSTCVTDGGYVYCLGSGTSQVFYARLSPSGVGPWTETTDYGATSGDSGSGGVDVGSAPSCVDNAGYIYCVGGYTTHPVSDVFYAPLNSSGVGAWTETTDYGASSGASGSGGVPIYATSCIDYSSSIICVGGALTNNTSVSRVYYAPVDRLGAWGLATPYLFASYFISCVTIHGFVICAGGGSSKVGVGAIQPTSSSSTSRSTSTMSSLTSGAGVGDILVGVAVLLALLGAGLGFFLYTRSKSGGVPQTTETPPPPPPPPQSPPQGPQPQDYAPPDVEAACCGPDITDNVLGAMIAMMNSFFAWEYGEQGKELAYLKRLPLGPNDPDPNFNNAWDISELAPSEDRGQQLGAGYKQTLKRYQGRCMKPDPPCYPSVAFLGQCHNPQVVNYVQWGVLAGLNEGYRRQPKAFGIGPEPGSTAADAAGGEEWPADYAGSNLSTYHYLRSGTGAPGVTDPNYQDQVAMSSVGYRLAQDYMLRMKAGKLPYALGQVNLPALTAILQSLQNPGRPTAKCTPGCKGCGKYQSAGPQNMTFNYVFGDQVGEYVPLSKL